MLNHPLDRRAILRAPHGTCLVLIRLLVLAVVVASGMSPHAGAQSRGYATDLDTNNVYAFDTSTLDILAAISVGVRPTGIATDAASGRAYVTASNQVVVIDTGSNTVVKTIGGVGSAVEIAIHPVLRKAFVSNYFGTVSVIDTSTDTLVASVPVSGILASIDIDVVRNKVYVARNDTNIVHVLDAITNAQLGTITTTGSGGNNGEGLAVNSSSGRAYVAYPQNRIVTVIDTTSDTVVASVPLLLAPHKVAVSRALNKAYVSGHQVSSLGTGDAILVIDGATNTVAASISTGIGSAPRGLAIDDSLKRGYVTIAGVSKGAAFDTETNGLIGTFPLGINPLYVALIASPAPAPKVEASASMLDFGFASTGTVADRQFTLTNKGTGVATAAVDVAAPFSLLTPANLSLAAGEFASVVVRFAPTVAARFDGTIAITGNAGNLAMNASGIAVDPPKSQPQIKEGPAAAPAGSVASVSGRHFGMSAGAVTVGGAQAAIHRWSDTEIAFTLPSLSPGRFSLRVSTQWGADTTQIDIVAIPVVANLSKLSTTPGSKIYVRGAGFGSAPGQVLFGGVQAPVSSWSDSSIGIVVPSMPKGSYDLFVLTAAGLASDPTSVRIRDVAIVIETSDCPEVLFFFASPVCPPIVLTPKGQNAGVVTFALENVTERWYSVRFSAVQASFDAAPVPLFGPNAFLMGPGWSYTFDVTLPQGSSIAFTADATDTFARMLSMFDFSLQLCSAVGAGCPKIPKNATDFLLTVTGFTNFLVSDAKFMAAFGKFYVAFEAGEYVRSLDAFLAMEQILSKEPYRTRLIQEASINASFVDGVGGFLAQARTAIVIGKAFGANVAPTTGSVRIIAR